MLIPVALKSMSNIMFLVAFYQNKDTIQYLCCVYDNMCASVSFSVDNFNQKLYKGAWEVAWEGSRNTSHIFGNYGKMNAFFHVARDGNGEHHNALCIFITNTAHYHQCVIFVADLILDGCFFEIGDASTFLLQEHSSSIRLPSFISKSLIYWWRHY